MHAVVANATPWERWLDLFDKGMHQLARLEVRSAAVAREPKPEILFALGLSELVLKRWREADRAFRKAGTLLAQGGIAGLPAGCGNIGAVIARILEIKDLRLIPIPKTVHWWLDNPSCVGQEDPTPLSPGRLPLRMEDVLFKSPLSVDSMKALERRAASFSFPVFDLRITESRVADVVRQRHVADERRASRTENKKPPQVSPRRDRAEKAARPEVKTVPAPPPSSPAPPGIGWFMGSEQKPPLPLPPVHAPVPVPTPASFSREDRVHPRFEILAMDQVAPPPPAPPGDPWAQWEEDLYQLVRAGQFSEAAKRVRSAVEKYPTSSRLREHEANVLGASGNAGEALNSWIETFRLANTTGADERADVAARKALSIAWNDGPEMNRIAKELATTGKPAMMRAILGAVAERMLEDRRVAAVESIGLALAELAARDAAARPEVQRLVSIIETITGDDASSVARRLKERLSR